MAGPSYPIAVYVKPGVVQSFKAVAADPRLRAQALALAKKKNAPRQYEGLVKAFARYDAESGATPLIARRLKNDARL